MGPMARFEPFRGLRYDDERIDYGAVTAPPYDVIGEAERAELGAKHPHQAVHLDLPLDDGDDQPVRRGLPDPG